jgi:hypothetical protein
LVAILAGYPVTGIEALIARSTPPDDEPRSSARRPPHAPRAEMEAPTMAAAPGTNRGARARGRNGPWAGMGTFVAAAILLVFSAFLIFIAACDDGEEPGVGIAIEDLNEHTDEFIGESVTVRGEINDIIGQRAFTFEAEDLLVVGVRTLPQ